MKNQKKTGRILTFTAPAGGVVSGGAYLIGGLLVVAQADARPVRSSKANPSACSR
jgi:predicted RecA/RadA family phage recombinase